MAKVKWLAHYSFYATLHNTTIYFRPPLLSSRLLCCFERVEAKLSRTNVRATLDILLSQADILLVENKTRTISITGMPDEGKTIQDFLDLKSYWISKGFVHMLNASMVEIEAILDDHASKDNPFYPDWVLKQLALIDSGVEVLGCADSLHTLILTVAVILKEILTLTESENQFDQPVLEGNGVDMFQAIDQDAFQFSLKKTDEKTTSSQIGSTSSQIDS
eukprot:CAMPEP_0201560070 /NCGR_PEP_ID=MMETSP0173_2-20130828/78005_1 /ASSEMBLY_ACC=CAM_ASM_000268 /TAXON_ID=218659 /ORGANISM="Vexillifera sp., Strain DIVA3 564/2" /LENGTH=218 /DNA_ID=CAMNT_0047974489 /DNA_START=116 /DNA_END=769 /DNA_ORIENTATION=+